MIPTVIVLGVAIGRWWAVPAAGIAWVVLLLAVGDLTLVGVPVAAALAMANAVIGVAVRKVVSLSLERLGGRPV